MLEQIHKHMKWIMWAIVVLITVTFLFFGLRTAPMSQRTVAQVDGYEISAEELNSLYQKMYDYYQRQMKEAVGENVRKIIRSQALHELVNNRLLVQEAERVGLRVSDEELQSYIARIPAFGDAGKFDRKVYERVLENNNMTPAAFEEKQRESLLIQKLESLVEDGVVVNDAELQAAYASKNPKTKGDSKGQMEIFKRTYLAEKQKSAFDAFVKNLESKAVVKIEDKTIGS